MTRAPRVRFAPSPTGYLHIGGVRTALFNWLWARKNGGSFILRIEDTDRERSTEENERVVIDALRWLGLGWDEGPDVGGPHGPYRQMERLPLYKEFGDKLVERKAAYRCYCTKDDLDRSRAELKARDPEAHWRYPGTCRDRTGPTPDVPPVLRLRAPTEGAVTYVDLVFGEVTTPNSAQQDAVIIRSDGVPLYNLGAVVDDITMDITLVARGRDHMINTPLQILLYEGLGATPPRFAHLPMMLGTDGTKLSKRHGAVSVSEYRDHGIPPHALLNYLVRFGWSHGDEEIFSMQSLVEKFDWDHVSTSDGKFDAKKLGSIAFEHLKRGDLTDDESYLAGVRPFLEKRGIADVDGRTLARALPLIRERGQTFEDAAFLLDYFFREPPEFDDKAVKKFLTPDKARHLPALREVVATVEPFARTELETHIQGWLDRSSIALKDVAQSARVGLTGRSASPGLYEVMEVLGRAKTLARLDRAIALSGSPEG